MARASRRTVGALLVAVVMVSSSLLVSSAGLAAQGRSSPLGVEARFPSGGPPSSSSIPTEPSRASPASGPDLYPAAGTVTDTAFVNYNATTAGNFASVVAGWEVGTPAFVPATNTLWFPTRPASVSPYPTPSSGPTLIYSITTNQFTGLVPALANSSAIVYDPSNGLLYASIWPDDSVVAFDPLAMSAVGIPIPVGTNPIAMVLDNSSQDLFVANEGSNNVSVINATTSSLTEAGIPTGANPVALANDVIDHRLFIADGGDSDLSTIDTLTDSPGTSVPLTGHAAGVAYSAAAGTVAVTVPSSHNLVMLGASSLGAIALPPVGTGASAVISSKNGSEFVVANGTGSDLVVVNATEGCVTCAEIDVEPSPSEMTVVPPTGLDYVFSSTNRSLAVVSLTVDRALAISPSLDAGPKSIAFDSLADRIFVADEVGNEITVLNATTLLTSAPPIALPSAPSTIVFGPTENFLYVGLTPGLEAINATTFAVVVQSTVSGSSAPLVVNPPAGLLWVLNSVEGLVGFQLGTLVPEVIVSMPVGFAGISSAALGPAGRDLYVANGNNGTVVVVNASTGTVVRPALDPGSGAVSVAYDPADDSIYVLGSNVTIINATSNEVDDVSVAIAPHNVATAIAFDPTRDALYAAASEGGSTPGGTLSVVDGSSIEASDGSVTVVPVGQLPGDVVPVIFPGSSSEGSAEIWVSNTASGTLSVISSPIAVTLLAASPSAIDLGQPVEILLQYVGGAGPASITYGGLPSGCLSTDVVEFDCTPTENGTFTITATLTALLGGFATASTALVIAGRLVVIETVVGAPASQFDVGSPVAVNASVLGGTAPYSIRWSFGDGTSATGDAARHAYSSPGTFVLSTTVSDGTGATAENATLVTIHSLPQVEVAASPAATTDVGVPITLVATVTGGSSLQSANWTLGNGTTLNGTSVRCAWDVSGIQTATFHYVDAAGVSVDRTLDVTVNPILSATIALKVGAESGASAVTLGESVSFSSNISGGTAPYTVNWSFGDGSFHVGAGAIHSYAVAGTYTIYANVTDAVGKSVSVALLLTVEAPSTSSSTSSNSFTDGILLGVLVGIAAGTAIVFFASRSRRRERPPPPSPYVPPTPTSPSAWSEE